MASRSAPPFCGCRPSRPHPDQYNRPPSLGVDHAPPPCFHPPRFPRPPPGGALRTTLGPNPAPGCLGRTPPLAGTWTEPLRFPAGLGSCLMASSLPVPSHSILPPDPSPWVPPPVTPGSPQSGAVADLFLPPAIVLPSSASPNASGTSDERCGTTLWSRALPARTPVRGGGQLNSSSFLPPSTLPPLGTRQRRPGEAGRILPTSAIRARRDPIGRWVVSL